MIFERRTHDFFPNLRHTVGGACCVYSATVDVPYYEPRRVKVIFELARSPNAPQILTDGPTESPHRYPDNDRTRLCVWYPSDPAEFRWVFDNGLLELLGLVRVHLFKEAWWRDTGEWPGPQAPHGEPTAV